MTPELQVVLDRVRYLCHGLTELHQVGVPTELLADLLAASPVDSPALSRQIQSRVQSRVQWVRLEELNPVLLAVEASLPQPRTQPGSHVSGLKQSSGNPWSGRRIAMGPEFGSTESVTVGVLENSVLRS